MNGLYAYFTQRAIINSNFNSGFTNSVKPKPFSTEPD